MLFPAYRAVQFLAEDAQHANVEQQMAGLDGRDISTEKLRRLRELDS
jgi:hypothetical protein